LIELGAISTVWASTSVAKAAGHQPSELTSDQEDNPVTDNWVYGFDFDWNKLRNRSMHAADVSLIYTVANNLFK
jgi:hypothetical protein